MDCLILVDNSNIYIEGQKCSAFRKGVLRSDANDREPMDISWRIDFEKLLTRLADGRKIRSAILVGSRPPPNDAVWKMAEQSGFTVITHDRDAANKEKAVDTELVARGTLIIATTPAPAVLVIASGDRDFCRWSTSHMSLSGPSRWPRFQAHLRHMDRWQSQSIRSGPSMAHLIS